MCLRWTDLFIHSIFISGGFLIMLRFSHSHLLFLYASWIDIFTLNIWVDNFFTFISYISINAHKYLSYLISAEMFRASQLYMNATYIYIYGYIYIYVCVCVCVCGLEKMQILPRKWNMSIYLTKISIIDS